MHKSKALNFKLTITKYLFWFFDAFRPLMGPRFVCIYHIPCQEYARSVLETRPIFVAIPMIIIRLLSCNPLTALYFRIRGKTP